MSSNRMESTFHDPHGRGRRTRSLKDLLNRFKRDPGRREVRLLEEGIAAEREGRIQDAYTKYSAALPLMVSDGDSAGELILLLELTQASRDLERLDESEDWARRLTERAAELGNMTMRAQGIAHLGWAHFKAGNLVEASKDWEEACIVAEAAQDRSLLLLNLGDLALLYVDLGRTSEARDKYQMALEIATELGDRREVDRVRSELAELDSRS